MTKKQPAFSRRLNHVRVTVWPNVTGTNGNTWYATEVRRRYYSESEKEWHDSYSFNGVADLCLVIEALEQARDFIRGQESDSGDDEGGQ